MFLLIGDIHLTDKARDDYRFGIFDWIEKQQCKSSIAATFLAGDITDSKDRHSATLVNKVVNGLTKLKPPIYIVMGNHDYSDPKNPFFKFLNHIDGLHFIIKPTIITVVKRMGIIPHVRTQELFDAALDKLADSGPIDCLLLHNTFDGAIAESGTRLSGLSASPIESMNPPLGVYAGDVHRPQTQGIVTYIGCPYQIKFGDNFEPRCIELSKSGVESYPWFEAPRKWALTVRGPENILNNKELAGSDQVKLTIEITREEAPEWKKIRQEVLDACKELSLDIYGTKIEIKTAKKKRMHIKDLAQDNRSIIEQFSIAENLSTKIKQTGIKLLEDK